MQSTCQILVLWEIRDSLESAIPIQFLVRGVRKIGSALQDQPSVAVVEKYVIAAQERVADDAVELGDFAHGGEAEGLHPCGFHLLHQQ